VLPELLISIANAGGGAQDSVCCGVDGIKRTQMAIIVLALSLNDEIYGFCGSRRLESCS